MKLPIHWLKEYVQTDATADEIGQALTAIGHMQDGTPQKIGQDEVLELEVRQNRADCLSIIGLSREYGAYANEKLVEPPLTSLSRQNNDELRPQIEDPGLCYRFNVLKINECGQEATPSWIEERLIAYGVEPIHPIVDITNYVMLEYGQPLHAFDADKLSGTQLAIRTAKKGETIELLGGKRITLRSDDVVIADAKGPVALAGLMGGARTAVSTKTTSILLEAATYNQASIRRTSLAHSIRTEASTRLEKFLHPHLTEIALTRAAKLLIDILGANVIAHADAYPKKAPHISIEFPTSEVSRLGGIALSTPEIISYLSRLELGIVKKDNETLQVDIPYFRTDLTHSADIVEEVLRLHGYDKIDSTHISQPPPPNITSTLFTFEERVRDVASTMGFDEQITEPLTHEKHPKKEPIHLENSLTSEKNMLRTNLLENLTKALKNRKKYGEKTVRLFEVGKVYYQKNGRYAEESTLGILFDAKNGDYAVAKGIVETICIQLERKYVENAVHISYIPSIKSYYIELSLEALFDAPPEKTVKLFTTPPQLLFHDFSFVVQATTPVGPILEEIKRVDPLVYDVTLGESPRKIDEDKKTIFIHVSYHDSEKTLTEEDVQGAREKILNLLKDRFSAEVRLK